MARYRVEVANKAAHIEIPDGPDAAKIAGTLRYMGKEIPGVRVAVVPMSGK